MFLDHVKAICALSYPATKQQPRSFLGIFEFCRIYIPNFELIAKSLYEAAKGPDDIPPDWTRETKKAYDDLKQALTQAPALDVPDLTKPFTLYVAEKKGI